jgi:hypothetical protein
MVKTSSNCGLKQKNITLHLEDKQVLTLCMCVCVYIYSLVCVCVCVYCVYVCECVYVCVRVIVCCKVAISRSSYFYRTSQSSLKK